jgi:xylulokinase
VSAVLACDIGGSGMRAALVDAAGETLAIHRCSAPPQHGRDGAAEIDPDAWWNRFEELAAALAAAAGPRFDAIEGVAVCGVTRTQVIVDRTGRPVRPALTWSDTRAEPELSALLERLPPDHPERPRVNAFHPLARLAWIAAHEPRALSAAAYVLDPKDYVNLRLTGRAATDPVSSARLIAAAEPGSDGASLLGAIGTSAAIVPPRLAPTDQVGRIATGHGGALARLEGRPVFCLANDTWAAALGMGALRPGFAYNLSGTTDVLGIVSARPVAAPGLMAVDWGPGLHHLGGPSQNGADTLIWLLDLLGLTSGEAGDIGGALETLLSAPRGRQPILFLPYLQGERTPHWDAALRGAALGLNRRHTRTDLAWAALEGIAFLNRLVLERAELALGAPVDEIRFGGGGATNEIWCQVKADVCERPIAVGAAREPGLLGCAIAAWFGLGRYGSLPAAQESMVRIVRRYRPRPEHAPAYRALFELYRRAEDALRPLSHALSAIDTRRRPMPGSAAPTRSKENVPQ